MENNIPAGMIAFDLETALKQPDRVRAKNNAKVSELVLLKTLDSMAKLLVVVDGEAYFLNEYGQRRYDDFLFLTEPEMWVNVYKHPMGIKSAGAAFSSKSEAITNLSKVEGYIGTYKLVKE